MRVYKSDVLRAIKHFNGRDQAKVVVLVEKMRRDTLTNVNRKLINDEYCEYCLYWDKENDRCGLKNTDCSPDDTESAIRRMLDALIDEEKIAEVGSNVME